MIKCFKIKPLLFFISFILICGICCTFFIFPKLAYANKISPRGITIVLDAGHGGRDAGTSNDELGLKESDINLEITMKIKSQLDNLGINTILTRSNKNGLYEANADNYKQNDMKKREEIIKNANPNLVISIHINSYSNSDICGAQAFYLYGNNDSKNLADGIQSQLKKQLINAKEESNFGDYFMLKCSNTPTTIVECGYLSNLDEAKLLGNSMYQERIAYAITCGVIKYFSLCGVD